MDIRATYLLDAESTCPMNRFFIRGVTPKEVGQPVGLGCSKEWQPEERSCIRLRAVAVQMKWVHLTCIEACP